MLDTDAPIMVYCYMSLVASIMLEKDVSAVMVHCYVSLAASIRTHQPRCTAT